MLKYTLGSAAAAALGLAAYKNVDVATQFKLASASGPLVRLLDPELSHRFGILCAKYGLFPVDPRPDPEALRMQVWGREFKNPIGLAAGFDKDAEVVEPMLKMGFGFIEVGSVTPLPQPGNPKPRVFRIRDLKASINRYGFNSIGLDAVAENLEEFAQRVARDPASKPGLLGINLGKNKTTEDAAEDYCKGLKQLVHFADFVVINVSSPNTPGLRSLQGRQQLEDLVGRVKALRDAGQWDQRGPPPLLVKIAPDLSEEDKADIAAVALGLRVDGLVVGNTTISRPEEVAKYPEAKEAGGLSGPPLMQKSTEVLADMYRLTGGRIPLVGCGGVSSGEDAYKKIRAGASLVELYTALAFEGPVVLPRIKEELAACLQRDGFSSVQQAVGADVPLGGGKQQAQAPPAAAAAAPKKGWFSR